MPAAMIQWLQCAHKQWRVRPWVVLQQHKQF
jgi:hypothetical protein